MDSAAAAYFGCGDTNPVPLPKYKGTQITYPTVIDGTDIGSNATTMSIYGVANKRAANYKTAKSVPGGTASATSPGTTKSVAELNIEVGTAFNAATPTAATVQAIRDATNTIFAQAAQRYVAKITLAAHMPGNGMGGSTRPDQIITTPAKNPTKGYWTGTGNWGIWKAADLAQATACGGSATQMPQAQEAPTGVTGAITGITKYSLKMNGGLACSKMTSSVASAGSNTATFGTVQPRVSQNGSGAGTTTATPSAAGTAVADACPTVSGIQVVAPCIVGAGTTASPAPVAPYEVALAVARRYAAGAGDAVVPAPTMQGATTWIPDTVGQASATAVPAALGVAVVVPAPEPFWDTRGWTVPNVAVFEPAEATLDVILEQARPPFIFRLYLVIPVIAPVTPVGASWAWGICVADPPQAVAWARSAAFQIPQFPVPVQ